MSKGVSQMLVVAVDAAKQREFKRIFPINLKVTSAFTLLFQHVVSNSFEEIFNRIQQN